MDDWDRSALSRIASIFEATNRAPDRTNCVSDTVLHEAEEKDVTTLKSKKNGPKDMNHIKWRRIMCIAIAKNNNSKYVIV